MANANKIWCLFSVDCNYDQPNNNLVCWWNGKPSIETIAKLMGVKWGACPDEHIVAVVNVHTGKVASLTKEGTDYRLEEVTEGKELS